MDYKIIKYIGRVSQKGDTAIQIQFEDLNRLKMYTEEELYEEIAASHNVDLSKIDEPAPYTKHSYQKVRNAEKLKKLKDRVKINRGVLPEMAEFWNSVSDDIRKVEYDRYDGLFIEPNVTYTMKLLVNPDNQEPGQFTDSWGKQKFIYNVKVIDVYPKEVAEDADHPVKLGDKFAWFLTYNCLVRLKQFLYGEKFVEEVEESAFKFKRKGSGKTTDYLFSRVK